MKKLSFILLAMLLLPSAAGCGPTGGVKAAGAGDLAGKSFVLASIDGKEYTGTKIPDLMFDENLRMSGSVCNRFTGKASLTDGVLRTGRMASTRMLCVDDNLNKLETKLFGMFLDGVRVSYDGVNLTLRSKRVFVYKTQ